MRLCRGVGDQHLDQLLDIHTARANHFHADALRHVTVFHNLFFICHRSSLRKPRVEFRKAKV